MATLRYQGTGQGCAVRATTPRSNASPDFRDVLQLAYTIWGCGQVSTMIGTYGTGELSAEALEVLVRDNFKLTPKDIINTLDLKWPIYAKTAAYGHFGRTAISPWEVLLKIFKDVPTDRRKLLGGIYSQEQHLYCHLWR